MVSGCFTANSTFVSTVLSMSPQHLSIFSSFITHTDWTPPVSTLTQSALLFVIPGRFAVVLLKARTTSRPISTLNLIHRLWLFTATLAANLDFVCFVGLTLEIRFSVLIKPSFCGIEITHAFETSKFL